MQEKILSEAKEYLKDPDGIIDAYNLSIIWTSKKLLDMTGYSVNDVGLLKATDFLDYEDDVKDIIVENRILAGGGTADVKWKTKKGRLKVKTQFRMFELKDGLYYAFKVLESSPLI